MSNIEISLIIPVYNAKNTIERLLDSIFKGNNKSCYEVILINDGSKDNTELIINKYIKANNINNLSYYAQENRGVSASRNRGIELSQGKYIIFSDSDDYFNPGYIDYCLDMINSVNYDLIVQSYSIIEEKKKIDITITEATVDKKDEILNLYYTLLREGIMNGPVVKIYRKDVITKNSIKFDEDIEFGEDLLFNLDVVNNIKSMKSENSHFYIYDRNNSVLTKKREEHYFEKRYKTWSKVRDKYEHYNLDKNDLYWAYIKIVYATCFRVFESRKSTSYQKDKLSEIMSLEDTKTILNNYKMQGIKEGVLLSILKTNNVKIILIFSKILFKIKEVIPKSMNRVSM